VGARRTRAIGARQRTLQAVLQSRETAGAGLREQQCPTRFEPPARTYQRASLARKPRHVILFSTWEIASAGPAPTMTQILVIAARTRNG